MSVIPQTVVWSYWGLHLIILLWCSIQSAIILKQFYKMKKENQNQNQTTNQDNDNNNIAKNTACKHWLDSVKFYDTVKSSIDSMSATVTFVRDVCQVTLSRLSRFFFLTNIVALYLVWDKLVLYLCVLVLALCLCL